MKIFSGEQVRLWDQYTIRHEPISSIDLMERAAIQCTEWISTNFPGHHVFNIFCAKGNNGGDGLAIARLLTQRNQQVIVHILEYGHKGTEDFQANLARLHHLPDVPIKFIQSAEHFPSLDPGSIIIDALFGSGLNRVLDGFTKELADHLNESNHTVISIDLPSGLFTDQSSKGNTIIKADYTLSFQCYKLAFLLAENARYIGQLHILDIGLHPDYYEQTTSDYELIDESFIRQIYRPRNQFGHKGNFGHALIIAGSYGKMGAAVLCGKACLRSGVGLVSYHIAQGGYGIIQASVPEAMVMTDFNTSFVTRIDGDLDMYASIGIGPGLGTASETSTLVKQVITEYKKPLVIDADALNNLSNYKKLFDHMLAGSILTPHPKEFERLFGASANEFNRVDLAIQTAKHLNVVIVLKGHHTLIATPKGNAYFNSTGNAGMATAGSGDVLTGIITGLLAQRYLPVNAAILGVYLHGLAGDLAAEQLSQEAMTAGDIIDNLGNAFLNIQDPMS